MSPVLGKKKFYSQSPDSSRRNLWQKVFVASFEQGERMRYLVRLKKKKKLEVVLTRGCGAGPGDVHSWAGSTEWSGWGVGQPA